MTDYAVHDLQSAPAASRPTLEKAKKTYGQIPNLYGVLAEAPAVVDAYATLTEQYRSTSLGKVEQNVVWLTAAVENDCHYCVPAHTAVAKMDGVPGDVVEALRSGRPIADPRLEALRRFTALTVVRRGQLAEDEVKAFFDAGFTRQQLLEVILGVAHKTISNYVNHFTQTPVDEAFAPFAWQRAAG